MHAESNNIQDYLKKSEVINYDHKLIVNKCLELEKDMENIENMENIEGMEEKRNQPDQEDLRICPGRYPSFRRYWSTGGHLYGIRSS